MNKWLGIGRLGKDVELRYTQAGKAFATFSLAVDDGYGDKRKTYWLSVVVWDKQAELCGNSIKKGSKVAVEGKLTTRQYEDKSGKKVTAWDIVAHSIEFLDPKGQQSQQSQPFTPTDEEIPF